MLNNAADAPFGGFDPDDVADPDTTGQIMECHVGIAAGEDQSQAVTEWKATDALVAELPVLVDVTTSNFPIRQISLNEEESLNLCVDTDEFGGWLDDGTGNVTSWIPCGFLIDLFAKSKDEFKEGKLEFRDYLNLTGND